MREPIVIDGVAYATKSVLKDKIRAITGSARLGQPLPEELNSFLLGLLQRHPSADIKIGAGIRYFFVRQNCVSGRITLGLWIRRTDDSAIDFSWVECLTPSQHKTQVLNAMRTAIQDQVYAFKSQTFLRVSSVPCCLSGLSVTICNADVHHDPTFLELAERFVEGDWDRIKVSGDEVARFGKVFADKVQEAAWAAHHRQVACLYVVHRDAHKHLKRVPVDLGRYDA